MFGNRSLFNLIWMMALFLAGCSQGAVVFAPTPAPPDLSPLTYTHPSEAFNIQVPRTWTLHEQVNETFASATFIRPDSNTSALTASVIRLAEENNNTELLDMINTYQNEARPSSYTEQERQRMEDGSWRLIGLRERPGGSLQTVNTFVQHRSEYVGVVEITLTEANDTPESLTELERAANTFQMNTDTELEPAPLTTLSQSAHAQLEITDVNTWQTANGVYFVTGEVANHSDTFIGGIPVRIALQREDGAELAEAYDTTMGYGIMPGDFAPFSLRFGQGQPPDATHFQLTLGNFGWNPEDTTPNGIIGADALDWSDESTMEDGVLVIEGTLTNTSDETVYDPLGVVTVFDSKQDVIAASFAILNDDELPPEETVDFVFRINEMGGTPANYILNIQARNEPSPENADDS